METEVNAAEGLHEQAGPATEETTEQVNGDAEEHASPNEGGDDGEQQPEAKSGETEEQRAKRKGGWQRKIERLERRLAEAEARASQQYRQPVAADAPADDPEPQPKDFDLGDGTYDVAKFTRAITIWAAREESKRLRDQIATEQAQQKAESEQQTVQEAYQERSRAAAETHDDFDEVAGEAYEALREVQSQPGAHAIADAFLRHEKGAELEYHFGQHPDELTRIAKLPPSVALVEIGMTIGRLADKKPAAPEGTPPPPAPKTTQAPKPITPVRKPAAADTPKPDSPDSDKLSADEWLRLRNAQVRNRKK